MNNEEEKNRKLNKLREHFGSSYTILLRDKSEYHEAERRVHFDNLSGNLWCANWCSKNTKLIHHATDGTVAGGYYIDEMLCNDCGWYTTYEREYG